MKQILNATGFTFIFTKVWIFLERVASLCLFVSLMGKFMFRSRTTSTSHVRNHLLTQTCDTICMCQVNLLINGVRCGWKMQRACKWSWGYVSHTIFLLILNTEQKRPENSVVSFTKSAKRSSLLCNTSQDNTKELQPNQTEYISLRRTFPSSEEMQQTVLKPQGSYIFNWR